MNALVRIFKQLPAEAEPLILELTSRIEKLRALDDDESRLVEEAIRREKRRTWQDKGRFRHIWTATEDLLLTTKGHTSKGLERIAIEIGVSYSAAKTRRSNIMNGKRKTQQCNQSLERVG